MNARARQQLRLQQTVERLSIAAVTYYGVGLVGYLAKPLPLDDWGWDINLVKAGAVPVIAFLVWLAVRGVRAHIEDPAPKTRPAAPAASAGCPDLPNSPVPSPSGSRSPVLFRQSQGRGETPAPLHRSAAHRTQFRDALAPGPVFDHRHQGGCRAVAAPRRIHGDSFKEQHAQALTAIREQPDRGLGGSDHQAFSSTATQAIRPGARSPKSRHRDLTRGFAGQGGGVGAIGRRQKGGLRRVILRSCSPDCDAVVHCPFGWGCYIRKDDAIH